MVDSSAPVQRVRESGSLTAAAHTRWLIGAIAWATVLATYLWLAPGNRSEADDAFWFAHDVRTAPLEHLLSGEHFRHLLYLPMGRLVVQAVQGLSDVGTYDILVVVSAVAAATTVVLFASLLRRRFAVTHKAAATAAAGLAVSYGFWRYGVEVEVYAVALLVLVASLHVGLSERPGVGAAIGAAVLGVLATLLHYGLLVPAALAVPLALLLRRRLVPLAAYVATAAVVLSASLYATYAFVEPGVSFPRYLVADGRGVSDAGLEPATIPRGMAGFGQAVVSGAFMFGYEPVAARLERAFPEKNFSEERYLGQRLGRMPRVISPLTLAGLAGATTFVALAFWRRRRPVTADVSRRRPAVVGMAVATAVSTVGLLATSAAAPEAWTVALPLVWVLVGLAFDRIDGGFARHAPVVLVAVLALHNWFGGMLPHRPVSGDLNAVKSAWLVANAGPSDAVVTAGGPGFFRYLRYHTPAEVVYLPDPAGEDTRSGEAVIAATSGAVYVTGDVLDPPEFVMADESPRRRVQRFQGLARSRLTRIAVDEFGGVYRVTQAP